MLRLQLVTADTYSLAMELCRIPLLRELLLVNDGPEPAEDLILEVGLRPDLGEPLRVPLPTLHGGESHNATDLPIRLPIGTLETLSEDRTIELHCRILREEQTLIEESRSLLLLAYNTLRWASSRGGDAPEAYACFVTPNHPVIAQVLKQTSHRLVAQGVDNALEGYQSGNPQRVMELVRSLYQTLGTLGISYINPPAGYWSTGQRIRLPDQVLQEGLGTCADLTPLAASCLEQMGLAPVLVCLEQHALPGVFLSEEAALLQAAVVDDVSTVQQLIDARQLLLFDSSSFVFNPQPDLETAVAKARDYLSGFEYLINVRHARRNGFVPLPIRMQVAQAPSDAVLPLTQQILQQAANAMAASSKTSGQATAAESTAAATDASSPLDSTVNGRFQAWQDRLLDLSTRSNRLLHLSNLDLTATVSLACEEALLDVMRDVADAALPQPVETNSLAALIKASSIAASNTFSFANQCDYSPYLAHLVGGLPEEWQQPCIEQINRAHERIQKSISRRLQRVLSGRKSSFLVLDVPESLLANLENILASDKALTLLGDQSSGSGDEALALTAVELSRGFCRTSIALGLDLPMPAAQLIRTGRVLAREARLAEEETGFSPLYLAFGLLQWSDRTGVPRLAPLLLYPVEVKVNPRSQQINVVRSKGEPIGNISLVERLRLDYELDLEILNAPPEDDQGIDLAAVIEALQRAIIGREGWRVIPAAVLTSFSFANFLLWRDLQDNRQQLLENEAVRHIATGGRDPFPDQLPDLQPEGLDAIATAQLPLVVDSDSSQMAAVHAALQGRSFVLQGPPGTGKSQTITNIIAAAMAANKTVLFVAEKAAAVEVVYSRLRSVGLDPFCLDIHKPDSNPDQVLKSFKQALDAQASALEDWERHCSELDELRCSLQSYTRALHQPRAIGSSLFQMLEAVAGHEPLPPLPKELDIDALDADRFAQQQRQIQTYANARAQVGDTSTLWSFVGDVDWGLELDQQLKVLLPRTLQALEQLKVQFSDTSQSHPLPDDASWDDITALARLIRLQPAQGFPPMLASQERWEPLSQLAADALRRGQHLLDLEQTLRSRWQDAAFEGGLEAPIQRIEALLRSFVVVRCVGGFLLKRKLQRLALRPLPDLRRILEDLRAIRDLDGQQQQLDHNDQELREQLGWWDGEAADRARALEAWNQIALELQANPALSSQLSQLASLPRDRRQGLVALLEQAVTGFSQTAELLHCSQLPLAEQRQESLAALIAWLEQLTTELPGLRSWVLAGRLDKEFRDSELGVLLTWIESASVPLAEMNSAYRMAVLQHWFRRSFDSEECLRSFNVTAHNERISRFRELHQKFLELSRRYVANKVVSRMPDRQHNVIGSELAELNREISKQRRRSPLRMLFRRIPSLLPKLKPCLLASPISVARFLPADGQRFDIVIFDEASQVETHHAIGAIGRGRQVVIVGDNKQMPPSSFFKRLTAPGDGALISDEVIEDLESILDEAVACGLPQQMLQWHYRSAHESLIAFSNERYYQGRLNIFPAPYRANPDLGIHWHGVPDGYYQQGARINEPEARALVEYLLSKLRLHRPGERSFGVITFSTPQQILIETLLQKACADEPDLDAWFSKEGNLDYCFVKNLETVQGDERDEILFSICFAPRQDGKFSLSLGALNGNGGERRLNVAITRSRCSLHVFSTLLPERIDRSRTNALAIHHLQDYLKYCQSQDQLSERPLRSGDFDSEMIRQVHQVLTREGYRVDCKVGCASYRVDLAVVDPEHAGVYRLGIECDGPAYAAASTVRDRDCTRSSVLQRLGWKLHRIWSVEWILNRTAEEQRLLDAVREAFEAPLPNNVGDAGTPTAAPVPAPVSVAASDARPGIIRSAVAPPPPPPLTAPAKPEQPALGIPYSLAVLPQISGNFQDFYLPQSIPLIEKTLQELIAVEAPILLREATGRVTQCWNNKALTQRALQTTLTITQQLHRRGHLHLDHEETIWSGREQSSSWQEFRRAPAGGRAISAVPPAERRVALESIVRKALSIDSEGLLREACLCLTGGSRFTQAQRQAMQQALEQLLTGGRVHLRDERVFPGPPS